MMRRLHMLTGIFSFRNWAVIVVAPTIGLLFIVINAPVFIAIPNNVPLPIAVSSVALFVGHVSFQQILFIALFSTLLGTIFQGIATIHWNWSKCSIHKHLSFQHHDCVERVEGRCKRFSERPIIQRLILVFVRVSVVDCERRGKEGEIPPPGSKEYADFQLHLEGNKEIHKYLEWEKFLKLLYEYLAIACILSLPPYMTLGVTSLNMHRSPDYFFIFLLLNLTVITWIFINTAAIHRNASDTALKFEYERWKKHKSFYTKFPDPVVLGR